MVWPELVTAGCKLGKAAAIAGAAFCAAPVVLPSLVVASGLALAFSVPSTILVAGYVCNEKLVTSLLSNGSPASAHQLDALEEESVDERPIKSEYGDQEGLLLTTSDQDGNEIILVSESVVQDGNEIIIVSESVDQMCTVPQLVQIPDTGSKRETIDETVLGMNGQHISTAFPDQLQDHVVVVVEEQAIIDILDLSSVTSESQSQQGSVADEGVHVLHSSITEEVKTTCMEVADVAAKIFPDEEDAGDIGMEIWEQINALRLILGYDEGRQETTIEELKVLYSLMGMEPPATIEPEQPIVNASIMLRCLKEVMGIS